MRNEKGKRKLAESSHGSDLTPTPDGDNSNERFVWISNDNSPGSPLTVQCLTRKVEKKARRVKRMKFGNKVSPNKGKRKDSKTDTIFPFVIDKTPSTVIHMMPSKRRRTSLNDSVILLDSPCSSRNLKQINRSSSRDSVDTVDLCSDSEDEGNKDKTKPELKKKTTNITSKNRNQNTVNVDLPIVINLDDEEESKNSVTESTSSVIVESNSTSSSQPSQKMTASTSSEVGTASFPLPPDPYSNKAGPSVHLTESIPLIPDTHGKPSFIGPSTSSNAISTVAEHRSGFTRSESKKIPDSFIPDPRDNIFNDKHFGRNTKNSGLSSVGSNVYNPNYNMEQIGPRPIIIDGCNVAIAHGGDREFSVRGLCICVDYFLRRGHTQVIAIVPLHQRSKVSHRDRDILEALRNDQHLVFTPSRFIDNRLISSYDDRFIVQYAAAVGGVIVSRDNYRDLLPENPAWKDTIQNRLLMPTWVGDMLMFPVDPLGKTGPTLDEFLHFPRK